MSKNLPKLGKYIFPSDKQWTGVWSVGYRDFHLPCASIDRVDISAILLKIIIRFMQSERTAYKSAASDEYILGVRKET